MVQSQHGRFFFSSLFSFLLLGTSLLFFFHFSFSFNYLFLIFFALAHLVSIYDLLFFFFFALFQIYFPHYIDEPHSNSVHILTNHSLIQYPRSIVEYPTLGNIAQHNLPTPTLVAGRSSGHHNELPQLANNCQVIKINTNCILF